MHWDFPFDGTMAHRVITGRQLDEKHCLLRVEAALTHAEALVDRDLQAWPPGLREYIARHPNLPRA